MCDISGLKMKSNYFILFFFQYLNDASGPLEITQGHKMMLLIFKCCKMYPFWLKFQYPPPLNDLNDYDDDVDDYDSSDNNRSNITNIKYNCYY
jgi:hypothetical protein